MPEEESPTTPDETGQAEGTQVKKLWQSLLVPPIAAAVIGPISFFIGLWWFAPFAAIILTICYAPVFQQSIRHRPASLRVMLVIFYLVGQSAVAIAATLGSCLLVFMSGGMM